MTDEEEVQVRLLGEWAQTTGMTRVLLNIALYDLWIVLNSIQLTITHPHLGSALREQLTRLGKQMEEDLARECPPAMVAVMAAGWDRGQDIELGERLPAAQVQALQKVADAAYVAWQLQLGDYVSDWAGSLRVALQQAGYDTE